MLGRLIGAVTTGGIVAVVAWLVAGSLALSIFLAIIAFIFTMFGQTIGSRRGSGSGGGSRRAGGSSSSSGGGFSGGGGSFGGGGASGRW